MDACDEDFALALQREEDERLARQIQNAADAETARDLQVRSALGDARADDQLERAHLLYIAAKINGKDVVMLVDTGAQNSIMTSNVAIHLGLRDKIDSSLNGMAGGVGAAQILGKIHGIDVLINNLDITMSFKVLDKTEFLIIFGLDMLEELGCVVDLGKRQLFIGGLEGLQVNFLHAHEIPEQFNLEKNMMQAVPPNCRQQ